MKLVTPAAMKWVKSQATVADSALEMTLAMQLNLTAKQSGIVLVDGHDVL